MGHVEITRLNAPHGTAEPHGPDGLEAFHPALAAWFRREVGTPTDAQRRGWSSIGTGAHTLVVAPTGSGKTLAAFLAGIDRLVRLGQAGALAEETHIVYVSPLKALSNDIHKNLALPLEGVTAELERRGEPCPGIRTAVRTGDTPARERAQMARHPPHILVTTPESLFILLNSDAGRSLLRTAGSVIVDEVHALVHDKRGAHLALSLERLDALSGRRLLRIGLSATQRPVEEVASFLVGTAKDGSRACEIVDGGHRRERDLGIELPGSPLQAVMAAEVWEEVHRRLCELIRAHQTTLVFVNTRRLAERLTRNLSEQLGPDAVTSHHGSLSKEQRLRAEQRLKQGSLKALVATASLELGIDIGFVDLVCQVGTVRSISTFLQRVGRSGHRLGATPKGRLFPLSRDELVEAAALFRAVNAGDLDTLRVPRGPLDILAQQITAATAMDEWDETALFDLARGAYAYRDLRREEFDAVVRMLAEGFSTRRGRRGARLHYDGVNGKLRARKGARIIVNTSGGAIPEMADYEVLEEPTGLRVGSINEDFAIESMAGDIFQLGNTSWRILRVEPGRVRVQNAQGQPPTIPFWLGEAPARSRELSATVSRLREQVAERLHEVVEVAGASREQGLAEAERWARQHSGIDAEAARQLVEYLASAYFSLGAMPSESTIVLERFFDEAGNMQLVVHSPRGARLNRAWGLSLRKRFCQRFNFELQAAANEDAVVLSLGPTHSFPLSDVFEYLKSATAEQLLIQAVLDAPMFMTRWRWNATRSLAVLRFRGGKKVPPRFQRMDADDLLSLVFPDSTACAENLSGPREIPEHPLVEQTLADCLTEAMDVDGLIELLRQIEAGEKRLVARDVAEASPLCHEILNARPYAFLDDAPLEERRTQAVMARRWLDPATADDLGALDPDAIARVRKEAWPEVRNADELHDALVMTGFFTLAEARENGWAALAEELARESRAAVAETGGATLWVAAERLPQLQAVFPDCRLSPPLSAPRNAARSEGRESAKVELLRGRLETLGPTTERQVAASLGMAASEVTATLAALESEGFVLRGRFEPGEGDQWCERRLLSRVHRYTLNRLRQEIQPVSAECFLRFLHRFQHVAAGTRLEGPRGVLAVLEQLEGLELPAAAWEAEVLAARVEHYDAAWLDSLCLSGQIVWMRSRLAVPADGGRRGAGPVRATPIALLPRASAHHWPAGATRGELVASLSGPARRAVEALERSGALFFPDLLREVGGLRTELEAALAELVASGLVTSDSFAGLRALIPNRRRERGRSRRAAVDAFAASGRWALVRREVQPEAQAESPLVEHVASSLLRRYGVVFRRLFERENAPVPWRDLLRVFRTREARGELRGGRFVAGFTGEQYALPDAVVELRQVARSRDEEPALLSVSAADPLNLAGILTPGERVPALTSNRVLYRGGEPIATKSGSVVEFLVDMEPATRARASRVLVASGRALLQSAISDPP
ncbi:MAG TPA: DEAD/DEAH box helicase [Polyangiaceae bacterium]